MAEPTATFLTLSAHAQFFAKWMQLSTQNQQLVKQYIGPLTLVIEWWAQLLAGKDGAVPGVASTLQQLLAPWAMVAMTDPAFGEEILPCAIKCMASKNDAVCAQPSASVIYGNGVVSGHQGSMRHL
jgi:hypothetical protein